MRPFPDPTILLHPQIPKPLHLLNPRTILGKEWWDEVRHAAYQLYGFRCHACGILKYGAAYRQWLEGHEVFDVNYITGRVEFVEVVALCYLCHNFIHIGRIERLVAKGEFSSDFRDVVEQHGQHILSDAKLPLDLGYQAVHCLAEIGKLCRWEDYHMVINGVDHGQRFKSVGEWERYWDGGQRG